MPTEKSATGVAAAASPVSTDSAAVGSDIWKYEKQRPAKIAAITGFLTVLYKPSAHVLKYDGEQLRQTSTAIVATSQSTKTLIEIRREIAGIQSSPSSDIASGTPSSRLFLDF